MSRPVLLTCSMVLLQLLVAGITFAASDTPTPASSPDAPAQEAGSPAPAEPSRLQVDERIQDIGEVPFGKRVPVHFELQNPGEAPVVIEDVAPVRGFSPALEVEAFTREIPPGGTGEIDLVLDTSKMVGEVRSPFQVLLQGAEEPMILEVAAEVRNHFAASPGRARWLYVQGEPTGTLLQHVWSRSGEDFEILDVRSPPSIDVEFRRAGPDDVLEDKPKPQWLVAPTLRTDAEVGPIKGFLEVLTDHPEQDRLLIPLSGFVRPALFLSPQEGDFGTVTVGEEPERGPFHLQVFTQEPIQIEKVEVVPALETVGASVETIQPGREYRVWVALLPGIDPGSYEGELRIHTDSDSHPVLRAPIRAVVEQPETPAD